MSKYYLELGFHVAGHRSLEDLDAHLDCVLDELHEDHRIADPDYSAVLSQGLVEYSMFLDAADEAGALNIAMGAMRAAIHAAEGCTRGWEAHFHPAQSTVRPEELADA